MESSEKRLESFTFVNGSITSLKEMILTELKSVIEQAEAAAASEAERFDKLRAEVSTLELKLKEKEERLQAKEVAVKELEEGLGARIRDLEGQLKHKDELLEIRDAKSKDLKSKMQATAERMAVMESQLRQAEETATGEAKRFEQLGESLKAEVNTLQVQLRKKEEAIQANEVAVKELKASLSARIRDLEGQLREKEQLARIHDDQNLRSRQLVQVREEQIKKLMSEVLVARVKLAKIENGAPQPEGSWKFQFWNGALEAGDSAEKSIEGDVGHSKESGNGRLSDVQKPSATERNQPHSLILAFKRYFCF